MTETRSASDEDLIAMARSQGPVDDSGKYGKPRTFDPTFHGPIKKRSCTDVICLILLLAFIGGWGVVAYFAFANGNWDRLLYPTDSRGRICGRQNGDVDLTNRPYLFYFDISTCLGPQTLFHGCRTPSVCVTQCPNKTFVWDNIDFKNDPADLICLDGVDKIAQATKPSSQRCASYYVQSGTIGGRCIPILNVLQSSDNRNATRLAAVPELPVPQAQIANGTKNLFDARAVLEKIFYDFSVSWWMIFIAFGMTMVISFLWIVIMRWVAGPMVWLGMLAVLGLLSYAVYYCFTRMAAIDALRKGDPGGQAPLFTLDINSYLAQRETWMAFGIISAIVLGILVLIALFLRNRIRLAVALLEEASKSVSTMMCTLMFPILPFILQLVVFGFWGLLAVLMSSAGEQKGILVTKGAPQNTSAEPVSCDLKQNFASNATHECIFGDYQRDSMYAYLQLYNIFGLFWLGFFVVGLGEMALAGAFASFYFTRRKVDDLSAFPLGASFGRCFRYHLGSIAFGSLIIAVVRFIRWILEQLDQKLKKSELGIARFLLKCCACCLWCLEKFLKFINRNAYIMVAIYGKNFCRSAKNAFELLMRNILRVVVLDKVTDFLLFLGKLVIVGAVGVGSFFFFARRIPGLEQYPPMLNYYYVPVITVIVGSYLIASAFFGVYAMAVDTLFLCFLEDLERNDGSKERPYYMSKNLMKILGKKNKKAKKENIKTTAA
ncbi:choline transporter-like protein 2 isoform X2 [Paramacrobiotus metropolitanus]|uniref:choline transporter-like protein 2 isoform X2 n=1 Tax=Paramacrobiotus metropolitanus TaxID=2943436 RepID=UPI002445F11B|nr:choline transporter-like protein 2 isoform X2 [Paramacrobiotus metropolitanus]